VTEFERHQVEARLRQRAEEITARREGLVQASANMTESELADYDQHPADQGTETHEQELDETTDLILEEELRQVQIAQERLESGEYGKCVDCGKDIPAARLEAVPEAVRCIEDQARYEATLRARGGPRQSP
jgi:DnaK suppressor protein